MKLLCVVGTRPNFIKMGALYNEFSLRKNIKPILVHTGQHYDQNMSDVFFDELGLPKPDINLGICGGFNTNQTANMMIKFAPVLKEINPDLVIVVGDVNSTVATALVTAEARKPLAHVEAGLRSGDRDMPEEINRIIVDHLSDLLFVTEQSGLDNLEKEGIPEDIAFFVGNVMVDSLLLHLEKAEKSRILQKLRLSKNEYILVTIHRPSNTDDKKVLNQITLALKEISYKKRILLPLHPRTRMRIKDFGLLHLIEKDSGFIITEPLGYLDFLNAMKNAFAVFTDSGGIQEETTILGVQCLTLRNNTERPATIKYGSNKIVGMNSKQIIEAFNNLVERSDRDIKYPPLWDGNAASRIVDVLNNVFNSNKGFHCR